MNPSFGEKPTAGVLKFQIYPSNTNGNFGMDKQTVEELQLLQMVTNTKENFKMVKDMVKES
jgi:hypothetical protein